MQSCRRWLQPALYLALIAPIFLSGCGQNMAQDSSLSPKRDINAVLAAHDKQLLAIPDVGGVYGRVVPDGRTPCLHVMLARKRPDTARKIPRSRAGHPVVVESTADMRAPE